MRLIRLVSRVSPALAAIAASIAPPASAGAHAADAARGERQFQRCYSCHSVDPTETVRLQGPSLYAVLGRKAGSLAGFDFSDAMRQRGAQGLVWTETTLDRLMADPEGFISGTRMSFPGLSDAEARADIIAYLETRK